MNTKQTDALRVYVRDALVHNDASHDYAHVLRVCRTALQIARTDGRSDLAHLIWLVAMFHDVWNHKYAFDLGPVQEDARKVLLEQFPNQSALVDRVIRLVGTISWSKGEQLGDDASDDDRYVVSAVRDADRLDAIGAIGIARCFIYGGAHCTTMQEQRQHFNDKLLRIEFRTVAGKRMARKRRAFLQRFAEQFDNEMRGT